MSLPEAPREVVVHLGGPKTGSTAIQRFLSVASRALAERGILYPDVGLRGFGHHDLAFLIGGGYPEWATPQSRGLNALVGDLHTALRRSEHRVVLSSENFFLQPEPERLREAIESAESGRRVRLLVYLRRQDDLVVSWYNQAVKAQGFSGSFAECLQKTESLWDFEAQLERWADAFGQDAITVRLYESSQLAGGEVVADLLAELGTDPEGLPAPEHSVNSGLCRELLEFQRQINRLPLTVQEKRRFHREWIELSARTRGTDVFDDTPVVGPAGRRAILERFSAGNRAVARRFFGREELFTEPLPSGPEPPEWSGPDPAVTQLALGWLLARTGSG